ncbi:MAG: murein biosynthesis integral membrane protein MurJ [Acidobacteriota bacterium]
MARRTQSVRAAGKVSVAVFISRILGLVREQVFAGLFGAGLYVDAWNVAFRIPNLLRDLFAEGALSSAFVPTFTDFLRRKGQSDAWLLANVVVSSLLVLLGGVGLALLLFPEVFVMLIASGFTEVPGKVEVTSVLIRILAPFLMFVATASVAMGVLNTLNHYFIPALAPAFFNVAVILAGFFLAPRFEDAGILPIYAMGVGAVMGGFLQFAVQWPVLRSQGYRFRFDLSFQHEGVRRIARLIGPALIGVSAVQVNVLVNTQLASYLGNGPVAWLNYAFRIIYLPIGLFGVAVGIVNLREVSAYAAQEKWDDFKETVANSIKLISFMAIPSTVGLFVLAIPIVDVLFERGGFTPGDTLATAYAVMLYSLGLFAYSNIKVYVPTFYALDDTRTPVRISIVSVITGIVVNLVLVLTLPAHYKYLGLAFGTALSVSINNTLLARNFRKKLGSLSSYRVAANVYKVMAAAAVMGLVVFFTHQFFLDLWPEMGLIRELIDLGISICLGGLVYLALCAALGVEEIRHIFARIRR